MKPNVIWIYCDELRADVLGCYGGEITAETPHIDSLATQGVRFDRCYTNSPVCVPSRMAVMSGRYPEQTGIYHNEAHWSNCRFSQSPDYPLLPEVFARAGYATASFGKSHLPHGLQPFDHLNLEGGGMKEIVELVPPESLIQPPGVTTNLGGDFPEDTPFPPEKVTKNGIEWMEKQSGPFFLRFSYLQPHTPVCPPPPYARMYENRELPDRITPAAESLFERSFAQTLGTDTMEPNKIRKTWQYYLGLVGWLDGEVGKILDAAKNLKNTIIVFDADHGASLGEGGCFAKHIFAPQSHRVPRIITWPDRFAPGQVRKDINESLDLGRTLLGLCGIDAPDAFRGRDLFNDEPPEAVYSTIGFGCEESRAFPNKSYGTYTGDTPWPRRACLRTERYRLDMNVKWRDEPVSPGDEDIFFTDLKKDPNERMNLVNDPSYADVVGRLRTRLLEHSRTGIEVCSWD